MYFVQIHGKILPEETELKNIVSGPYGPIHSKVIGQGIIDAKDLIYSKRLQTEKLLSLMDTSQGFTCRHISLFHLPVLVLSPWVYYFCNTATLGTFEKVIAHEKLCAKNRHMKFNKNI